MTDRDLSLEEVWPKVGKMVVYGWVFSIHSGFIRAGRGGIELTEFCDVADVGQLSKAIVRLASQAG